MEKTKAYLEAKREHYTSERNILKAKDYSKEIEEEVKKYRQSLVEEYESEREEDIRKIDFYLELLEEELEDVEECIGNGAEVVDEKAESPTAQNIG